VIVGEQDVLRVADLQRHRVGAVADLLLGLRGEEFPVLDIVEHELVAHVVLDRDLVDVARRLGVADVEAGRGEGVGAPDIGEGAAAAIGHPDAGILRVPTAVGHRIAAAGLGRAQRLAVGGGRAAAAHDLDVA
jgi:hypothetical protein